MNEGYDLVITHGNGPQVGIYLMRNDAGEQFIILPRCQLIFVLLIHREG